jgi:hypothetical protein
MKYRYFKKSSSKGVVLITVTVMIMVLMVLTISIMSLNLSQATISEDEVRRVQAEALAYGALSYTLALENAPGPVDVDETLDGHDFDVTVSLDNTNPAGPNDLTIQVDY